MKGILLALGAASIALVGINTYKGVGEAADRANAQEYQQPDRKIIDAIEDRYALLNERHEQTLPLVDDNNETQYLAFQSYDLNISKWFDEYVTAIDRCKKGQPSACMAADDALDGYQDTVEDFEHMVQTDTLTNYSKVDMESVGLHLQASSQLCDEGIDESCADAEIYAEVLNEMKENGGTIDPAVISFYKNLKFD